MAQMLRRAKNELIKEVYSIDIRVPPRLDGKMPGNTHGSGDYRGKRAV
jgi:hypothetical protein